MYSKTTPISGDKITYYTKEDLYQCYIEEGRSHTDALALSQKLVKVIENMNKQEIRMWQRSLRDKGMWSPKPKVKNS